jgi:hypothetical protein
MEPPVKASSYTRLLNVVTCFCAETTEGSPVDGGHDGVRGFSVSAFCYISHHPRPPYANQARSSVISCNKTGKV